MNSMLKLLAFCCFLSIVSSSYVESQSSELLGLVTIFRHGDRAPIRSYKNDPYNESYWPMGFGQLTNIGKRQEYYLGQWFRQTYASFVPDLFSIDFLRVQSSSVDRCLMSASAHLAGLYPPVGRQVWNPSLKWQPIPVHTARVKNDPILAYDKSCPKFRQLLDDVEQNEFHDFFEQYKDIFDTLAINSGENITTIDDFLLIANTLYIEKLYNLTLPKWAEDIFPTLEFLANVSLTAPSYTPDLARLRNGPLLDYITSFFEDIVSNSSTLRYLILSGHDTTIVALLNSLGIFDYLWPEYASSVILELRHENNNPFVNIFYKNSTYIKNLTLKSCTFDCQFENFQQIVEPLRINLTNWDEECETYVHL